MAQNETGGDVTFELALPKGTMGTSTQMLTGGVLLTIGGFIRGEQITEMPTVGAWLALVYLMVFGSIWAPAGAPAARLNVSWVHLYAAPHRL